MNMIVKGGFFAALLLVANTVMAQIVTVPPGLQPGDQYRLILSYDDQESIPYTDHRVAATSADISFYNNYVNEVAAYYDSLAGITWYALGSTSAVDARDNTNTNPNTADPDVPIYSLTGAMVADGNDDLWDGDIQNFVVDPGCLCEDSNEVWTGSEPDGTKSGENYWLGSGGQVNYGYMQEQTDSRWIKHGNRPGTQILGIAAISEVLVVPRGIPSLSQWGGVLLTLILAMFAVVRLRGA